MKDLTLAIKLTTQGGQIVVRDINTVSKTVQQANNQLDNTAAAGNRARKGLDNTAEGANALDSHLLSLKSTAGLVASALVAVGATQLFSGASQTLADFQDLRTRLEQLSGSAAAYAANEQYLITLSNEHHKELTSLGNSYASLLVLQQAGLVNQRQARSMLEGMSNLQSAVGATTEQLSQSMYGLSQALASPIVHAEELSQVTEPLPGLLNKMDTAAGLASGGIRQLVLAGQMTSSMFRDVLIKALNEYNGAAAATADNISALYRDNSNAYQQMVLAYEAPINDSLSPVLRSSVSVMQLATEHADLLMTAIGVTLAAAVGRGSAALITHSAELVRNEIANNRGRIATIAAAQAELQRATAQRAAAISAGQAVVAEARLTAARQALTAATTTATLSTRALNTAMALVGGPMGAVMMAASALAYFVLQTDDAADAIPKLQKPIQELREEFRLLTEDQRAATFIKWSDAAAVATQKVADAYAELQNDISRGMNAADGRFKGFYSGIPLFITELKSAIDEAKNAGENLSPVIQNIGEKYHIPQENIDRWVLLAGAVSDATLSASNANNVVNTIRQSFLTLDGQLDELVAGPLFAGEAIEKTTEQNTALQQTLLKLYNAQKLNAEAVDQYGRALTGIDLEIFKAQFQQATKLPADATAEIKKFAEQAAAAEATLNLSKYLGELRQQNSLLAKQTQSSEQLLTINRELAKYQGADPKLLAAARQQLQLLQEQQALQTDQRTLTVMQQQTDLLQVRLEQGAQEYELQKALRALKSNNGDVMAALTAEIEAQQLLNAQIAISEDISSGAFNKMLEDMSALSLAGNDVGDVLVESFGRVAQQLDAMGESQLRYNRSLDALKQKRTEVEKLEKNSPQRAKALLDIKQTESRLQQEYFQNQMGQYSSLAGAASKMFGEQSSAREKLHKIETAFAAIETALALKKAAANALAAITNQGSGDPYTAFARIAAMAALMAALGVFSGSASGSANISADRQASQGTGTVLGSDDKSASLTNSLERIESLELDQYVELREINNNIKSLSAGITKLAVSLVGQFGRFDEQNYGGELGTTKQFQISDAMASIVEPIDKLLGGFATGILNSVLGGLSKTTKKLLDSGISFDAQKLGDIIATGLVDASYYNVIETTKKKLWGLVKKKSTKTEYTELDNALLAEFGRIFTHIGSSITEAVNLLALDTTKALEDFAINLPNVSFKDLSGDEIQAELEAIFSQQADLMVQYLVPAIGQYQQMGEGLYDTLIRVAQEQAIFNAQLDALGLSLGDLGAALRIDVAQSIIQLMGGVEAFRDATSQYFSSFYSESEQFAYLSKSLSQAMANLGVSFPATRDAFKAIVDGIDLTTEAGQTLFAALMALVPGLDEYFKALEQQTNAAANAAAAEQALAEKRASFSADHKKALEQLDMTALQRNLDDLQTWYDEQLAMAEELGADTVFLERLYARKRQDIINNELAAIANATASAMTKLTTEHERAVSELTANYDKLVNSMQSVGSNITNSILAISRAMHGWDEVGYQATQVATLQAQLGTGDIANQVNTLEQLQAAIMARYNAELAANAELATQQQTMIDELRSAYEQLVSSIANASDEIANSLLEIRRQTPGWDEADYQTAQVATLQALLGTGDIASQVSNIEQLQTAITARYNAELAANAELATHQQAVIDELRSAYEQLVGSIQSTTNSISNMILDLQRQGNGWDEVSYQTELVNHLRSQLGMGSAAEQVNTISQLQQAISGRYQAELTANKQLQDAANQRYQQELAAVQAIRQAAQQLQQAADAMLLSDASPALLGQQMAEAKRQFDTLLTAANAGDADAARQLQQVGSSYLDIAKDYYAQGSDEYAAIFNAIQNAYRGVAANAPDEPKVPTAVLAYQRADAALQKTAIEELTQLQSLLSTLEQQAAQDQAEQLATAEAALASYQASALALQQGAIDELTQLQSLLSSLGQQAAQEQAEQLASAEAALASYQAAALALQQGTIDELTQLQGVLAALEQQAAQEQAEQLALLQQQLETQTEALLAEQQHQIDAINSGTTAIVDAIVANPPVYIIQPVAPVDNILPVAPVVNAANSIPVNTTSSTEPNQSVVDELRAQREDARAQNITLVKEVTRLRTELRRTQDLVLSSKRIA